MPRRRLDQPQRGQLLQRDGEQFRLPRPARSRPCASRRVRRRPPAGRTRCSSSSVRLVPPGEVLGDQQRDMAVGALLGHPHVGQLVVRVDHGDALGAHLGRSARWPRSIRRVIACRWDEQVGAFVLVELVVVHDRVVQQPPGEPPAQRLVAQFVALGDRFGGQFREPLLERRGGDGRTGPGCPTAARSVPACARRTARRRRPTGTRPRPRRPGSARPSRAAAGPPRPGRTGRPAVQGQREPGRRQSGFGGGGQHVVGEAAERGLRVGAGECGQGQAQGDVPAAAERLLVVSARGMGTRRTAAGRS